MRRKLAAAGVEEIAGKGKKGKGSHREFRQGTIGFPVPYHGDNADVKPCYLRKLEELFGVDLR